MKRHYTYGEERGAGTLLYGDARIWVGGTYRTACGLWLQLDACADDVTGVTCASCSRAMERDAPDLTVRCVHRWDAHAGLHDWHCTTLEAAP